MRALDASDATRTFTASSDRFVYIPKQKMTVKIRSAIVLPISIKSVSLTSQVYYPKRLGYVAVPCQTPGISSHRFEAAEGTPAIAMPAIRIGSKLCNEASQNWIGHVLVSPSLQTPEPDAVGG